MPSDFLVCKTCCLCMPLRYGLLTWGYLKTFLDLFFIYFLGAIWYSHVLFCMTMEDLITTTLVIFGTIMDAIMSIIFLIGCHQKKLSVIKCYNTYVKIFLMLIIMTCAHNMLFVASGCEREGISPKVILWGYLTLIAAHCFMLFILRSEIIKLENNTESTTTEMTQPECTLKMIEDTEKQNEIE
ncbi:uncharacterized protein LOC142977229 [Anticarsia gemmatalis]|uniref:uncharacterized protein LOC142977229 n=1 Tax=Anticarsia gemmatalis TaxID=129554 RepID=UPI003F76D02A